MIETNKIYKMDAIELLKQLPDNSVDVVLTYPPYYLDFSKNDTLTDKTGRKFHHTENLNWDLKKNIDLKEVGKIIFKEFDRIIKETGSVIIFAPQEWAYYYFEPAIENNFDLKCQLIWVKSNPIPQMSGNGRLGRLKDENNQALHPTQKPLELIRKLIQIHSNLNDLIVDCFIGSGTTAVACKELGRNFICCDINEKYVNISNERIKFKTIGQFCSNETHNSDLTERL